MGWTGHPGNEQSTKRHLYATESMESNWNMHVFSLYIKYKYFNLIRSVALLVSVEQYNSIENLRNRRCHIFTPFLPITAQSEILILKLPPKPTSADGLNRVVSSFTVSLRQPQDLKAQTGRTQIAVALLCGENGGGDTRDLRVQEFDGDVHGGCAESGGEVFECALDRAFYHCIFEAGEGGECGDSN